MSDRPTNVHDPLACGLYRAIVPRDDNVDHGKWLRAHAEGSFVGECRQCGGYLRPLRPYEVAPARTDYEAECINCHHGVLAPGGRTLRRSGRHGEQPNGWWDHRIQRLKNTREAAA